MNMCVYIIIQIFCSLETDLNVQDPVTSNFPYLA